MTADPAPPPQKRCGKCGKVRPFDQFTIDRRSADGRHHYCQPCRRETARRKYAANPAVGLSLDAYKAIKGRSKRRGIEFQFTYEEWLAWWEKALAEHGPHAKRGKGKDLLVMCRIGDRGPYAADNVYCGTPAQNRADIPPEKRRHNNYWLRGRFGADHPRSNAWKARLSSPAT